MKIIEDSFKQYEDDCSRDPSPDKIEKLENAKNKYESFYEHVTKGAIIRSGAIWYEYGEKSNKYFLNLETHRKSKSCIRKVYTEEDFLTSDPKRIMKELDGFYSSLYKKDNLKASEDVLNWFLRRQVVPKLSKEDALYVRAD